LTGLRVIGVGFGCTGTYSLKTALEELGFGPCYHMTEVLRPPRRAGDWEAAANSETVDWDEVFSSYGSAVDWPACTFYRELAAKYPEAKIILTTRDPDRWYRSVRETIYTGHSLSESRRWRAILPLVPAARLLIRRRRSGR
jgi:hypothetical protein